jgi:phosphoribosyl-dephospho-CoA transferase
MLPELTTHTLLRIAGAEALATNPEPPVWVSQSLLRAPWVVVRRAQSRDEMIPVGVRGESRRQRFASWVSPAAILECVTPRALALLRAWTDSPRRAEVPALAELDSVEKIMRSHGLEGLWGPTGSVGFELTCGYRAATVGSDLDLAVHLDRPLRAADARSLHDALAVLAVRSDVLLETPHGAVALAEYARMPGPFVLRTPLGPRLIGNLCSCGESI